MNQRGHTQQDVVRLSKQSQSQVSKFLSGRRHRITDAVRAICRYAEIEIDDATASFPSPVPLSQSVRRVLAHNPHAAELVARIIEALLPVLSNLDNPANSSPKEAP
jgi:transcriptional regulator with XRE-family HTH domain